MLACVILIKVTGLIVFLLSYFTERVNMKKLEPRRVFTKVTLL